ncbi:MAG: succinate-semialdehyde dehydrogenase (NADP(+)) [Rickettsiales bacterium]|nr:succinate-semialdehyde dehydrogenase (NADP(+)) [Rickettsiales bacterium]
MLKKNSYLSFINGEWIEGSSNISIKNPCTGESLGFLSDVGESGAVKAIEAANNAFELWRETTAEERSFLLKKWFNLIMKNKNVIAETISKESGKPLKESLVEVTYGASFIEWFAEQATRSSGKILQSPEKNKQLMVIKQPIGVVSAITPWNFPMAMATRKTGAALAAGCTVVLKPSELTPITALKLAKLSIDAGIPKGVFNVVNGRPQPIGKVMSNHKFVRKITFTGSTRVGKYLMKEASKSVKSISLELGGNAPFIVLDDADIDDAVNGLVDSKFRNAGQTCISANRIFLHKSIHDNFIKKLKEKILSFNIGNGLKNSDIGPLISKKAIEKIELNVSDAIKKGAKILLGGKRHRAGELFYEPSIITNVKKNMKVFKEENFGPIVPIINFTSIDEVIDLANNTEYGLAAYFFTKNSKNLWKLSSKLEYGMFGVNTGKISTYLNPFGGLKESGLGREGSEEGLEPFLEKKFISWRMS